MRIFSVFVLLLLAIASHAQSRRVSPNAARPTAEVPAAAAQADRPVKEMFDEANAYNKVKFAEFERKKLPVSDALIAQTQRERKQLAAKYAAIVQGRTNLAGEDIYYLGMLHWVADNLDATRETFVK
jgi:hypothetical protein